MNILATARTLSIAATLSIAGLAASAAWALPVFATNSIAQAIPDNNSVGIDSVVTFGTSGLINSMSLLVAIDHPWLGDLVVTLTNGSNTVTLMDRPGLPIPFAFGDSSNLLATAPLTFSDAASSLNPAELMGLNCTASQTIGVDFLCSDTVFRPQEPLSAFNGSNIQGNWTLKVSDRSANDFGRLASWTLRADVSSQVPEPAALALVGLALAAAGATTRRRAQPGA